MAAHRSPHLCARWLPQQLDDGDARARDGKHVAARVGVLQEQLLQLLDSLT